MTCREPLRRSYVAALLLALAPLGLVHCGQPVEYGEQGHTKFTGPAYLTVGGVLTGRHAEIACESCHVTGDYAVFSCIDCHEHRQGEMDDEHDDVGDYQWTSAACLDCHPNGEEDD